MENYKKAVLFICKFKVSGMLYEQAKECALIDIENTIDLLNEISFNIDGHSGYFQRKLNELQDIKQEIEKFY